VLYNPELNTAAETPKTHNPPRPTIFAKPQMVPIRLISGRGRCDRSQLKNQYAIGRRCDVRGLWRAG
jgi:hypothetical protein